MYYITIVENVSFMLQSSIFSLCFVTKGKNRLIYSYTYINLEDSSMMHAVVLSFIN